MSVLFPPQHRAASMPLESANWLGSVHRWVGRRAVATLPQETRLYAVGDIHGRSDLLDALLDRIEDDINNGPKRTLIVFVGDYVDRGPDSRGVVARLLDLRLRRECHFIRGNHDQAVLDFIANPVTYATWKDFGGQETLWSYGVRPPKFEQRKFIFEAHKEFVARLPKSHLAFFDDLLPFFEIGGYYFTHAGVRPGIPLSLQRREDLMWIREEFLASPANFGKVIVHGHSPIGTALRRHNRISIDTGAYATGRLTAVVLEDETCRFLQT